MNSVRKDKYLIWLEPSRVKERFYPFVPNARKRTSVILAFAGSFAVLGLLTLSRSAGAKLMDIAGMSLLGGLIGYGFAYWIPATDRKSAQVAITAKGIERLHSMGALVFPFAVWFCDIDRRTIAWPWERIGQICLTSVSIDGKLERVLVLADHHQGILGIAGVAANIDDERLDVCLAANGRSLSRDEVAIDNFEPLN